jgi:hypothetical protein
VGDQSSGKSSALEAITRLPFPVDDTMCTRFATEVTLHRSTGSDSLSVSIRMNDGPAVTPIDFPEIANLPFDSYEFRLQFKELIDAVSLSIYCWPLIVSYTVLMHYRSGKQPDFGKPARQPSTQQSHLTDQGQRPKASQSYDC